MCHPRAARCSNGATPGTVGAPMEHHQQPSVHQGNIAGDRRAAAKHRRRPSCCSETSPVTIVLQQNIADNRSGCNETSLATFMLQQNIARGRRVVMQHRHCNEALPVGVASMMELRWADGGASPCWCVALQWSIAAMSGARCSVADGDRCKRRRDMEGVANDQFRRRGMHLWL